MDQSPRRCRGGDVYDPARTVMRQVRVRSLDKQRWSLAIQVEGCVPEIKIELMDRLCVHSGGVVYNDIDLEGAICTLEMRLRCVDNLLRSGNLAEVGTNWQSLDVVLRLEFLGEGGSTRVRSRGSVVDDYIGATRGKMLGNRCTKA
jgi:hypothetical protein